MKHFIIPSMEVPAYIGTKTKMDTSVIPALVHELHLDFQGWLGDQLMRVSPVHLITDRLAIHLAVAKCTGFSLSNFSYRICSAFRIYSKGVVLPEMRWLKVPGTSFEDDLWLHRKVYLCVSQKALDIILSTQPKQLEWRPYQEWLEEQEEYERWEKSQGVGETEVK